VPYTYQSNQIGAATALNSFLMDDPEYLGEVFYQQLLMATPQLATMAVGASGSVMMSGGGRLLRAVRSAGKGLYKDIGGPKPLYRGLAHDHPQLLTYNETGVIQPRGGNASVREHVNFGNTRSNVTSWTTRSSVAAKFAGPNGTVLMVDRSTIPNTTYDSWMWSKFPFEFEVSIQGPVHGASVVGR
ncbi:MAG: hypothetical protein GY751_23110, partial [Bacteroidetes bacterium]|nr:hypothetical protein [Bacteroidota bacterium]